MKHCALTFVALVLTLGCQPDTTAEAKRGDLSKVGPISESRADLAIERAKASVRQSPKATRGYLALGQALMQRARETSRLDDYSAALTSFEKAVAIDGTDPAALHSLAWCWTMFHRFDKAVALADRAIKVSPSDPTAYGVKFDSEMELGRYAEAGKAGQRMLDLRPCLASYSRAAQYRWVVGDGKGAIMLMKRAMEAGGAYAENGLWCRVQLGDYAFKTGSLMAAEQNYQQALDLDGDYVHALFGLARVRLVQGRKEEGMALMAKVTAQSCPMPYRLEHASLLLRDGKRADAETQFKKVEQTIAEHKSFGIKGDEVVQAELWMLKGGDKDKALRLMEAESKEHVNWQTLSALSWAQALNGQHEEAQASMKRALASGVQEPFLWARAAKVYERAGEHEAAMRTMAAAQNLNPYLASLAE